MCCLFLGVVLGVTLTQMFNIFASLHRSCLVILRGLSLVEKFLMPFGQLFHHDSSLNLHSMGQTTLSLIQLIYQQVKTAANIVLGLFLM